MVALAVVGIMACVEPIYLDMPYETVEIEFVASDRAVLDTCTLYSSAGNDPPQELNCLSGRTGGQSYLLWPATEDESERWGNLHPDSLHTEYVCEQRAEKAGGFIVSLGHCLGRFY